MQDYPASESPADLPLYSLFSSASERSSSDQGIMRIRRPSPEILIPCRFTHFTPHYPFRLRYYTTGSYHTLTWDRCEGIITSSTVVIHGEHPSPPRPLHYLILGKRDHLTATIVMKVGSTIKLTFPSGNDSSPETWTIYGSSVGWTSRSPARGGTE